MLAYDKATEELTELQQYNLVEDDYATNDDLERFLGEERAPSNTNTLTWWQTNHQRFPILTRTAFDLLNTPASSSADE